MTREMPATAATAAMTPTAVAERVGAGAGGGVGEAEQTLNQVKNINIKLALKQLRGPGIFWGFFL